MIQTVTLFGMMQWCPKRFAVYSRILSRDIYWLYVQSVQIHFRLFSLSKERHIASVVSIFLANTKSHNPKDTVLWRSDQGSDPPLITKYRVHFQTGSCGICAEHSGTGTHSPNSVIIALPLSLYRRSLSIPPLTPSLCKLADLQRRSQPPLKWHCPYPYVSATLNCAMRQLFGALSNSEAQQVTTLCVRACVCVSLQILKWCLIFPKPGVTSNLPNTPAPCTSLYCNQQQHKEALPDLTTASNCSLMPSVTERGEWQGGAVNRPGLVTCNDADRLTHSVRNVRHGDAA
jgi:hypothetical protein